MHRCTHVHTHTHELCVYGEGLLKLLKPLANSQMQQARTVQDRKQTGYRPQKLWLLCLQAWAGRDIAVSYNSKFRNYNGCIVMPHSSNNMDTTVAYHNVLTQHVTLLVANLSNKPSIGKVCKWRTIAKTNVMIHCEAKQIIAVFRHHNKLLFIITETSYTRFSLTCILFQSCSNNCFHFW